MDRKFRIYAISEIMEWKVKAKYLHKNNKNNRMRKMKCN